MTLASKATINMCILRLFDHSLKSTRSHSLPASRLGRRLDKGVELSEFIHSLHRYSIRLATSMPIRREEVFMGFSDTVMLIDAFVKLEKACVRFGEQLVVDVH